MVWLLGLRLLALRSVTMFPEDAEALLIFGALLRRLSVKYS